MQFDELLPESLGYAPVASTSGEDRRALPACGGVYLLTDVEDRLIQLAAAADLRRTLAGRLSACPPTESAVAGPARRRADLGQIVRRIRWRRAHSQFEITWHYYLLARALMPQSYLRQVGFGPCWFVHVDPAAEFPRFQVGKRLRSPPGVDLGPFATQPDAARFVEILEDAFDLCRHYSILVQAPHGQPCSYLDMGKCPAPCDGRVPMSLYLEMMGDALAYAQGDREPAQQRWEAAMRAAAAGQAYERAGAIKQTIERARQIEHQAFRLVRPVSQFRYLIIQRGPGTQVQPFFVHAGSIEAGEPVKLRQVAASAGEWLDRLKAQGREVIADEEDQALRSEQMWLVSHFLFKREPPGLYVSGSENADAGDLAQRVQVCFARRRREVIRAPDEVEGGLPAGERSEPGELRLSADDPETGSCITRDDA